MPTYDYQCKACQHEFSALHKIAEPAPPCPHCGHAEVQKKLAAPAVRGGNDKTPPMGQGCGMGGCGHRH